MSLLRRLGGRERTGSPADLLAVGLGNPGEDYAGSRHNVGADAIEVLADRHGGRLKVGRERARVAEVNISGLRLALAIPTTYMNESGVAVQGLVRRYGIDDVQRLVIVQDELDLDPGRMKIKIAGGLAGHNGLKSIKAHLDTAEFVRVRIGVGKPPRPEAGANYVLKRVPKAERAELDLAIERAADAVETILADGAEAARNAHNSNPDPGQNAADS